MNHQILTLRQKKWLGWIITNQWEWLNIHINAPANHQKLNWTYTTGLYDISTKELLNFILNRFNEDEVTKAFWRVHNKHT